MPLKDKDAHRAYCRQYSKEHRVENIKRAIEWNKNHPDRRRELSMEYHQNHNSTEKAYREIYKIVYPDKIKSLRRNQHLKYSYNVSISEYDRILTQQNNNCAICHKEFQKTPCIDHEHETGKIRGLLCRKCNFLIGFARDNIGILKEAIKYLNGGANVF